jgi:hypothetical protein
VALGLTLNTRNGKLQVKVVDVAVVVYVSGLGFEIILVQVHQRRRRSGVLECEEAESLFF